MREKEREILQNVQYQNVQIDKEIPNALEDFKECARDLEFVYDLNDLVRDCRESLFGNHWIHCNAKGNAMIANEVFRILKLRNLV